MSIEEEITMALSQADVLAGLKEIVEEVAGVSASLIELDKNFTDDLDVTLDFRLCSTRANNDPNIVFKHKSQTICWGQFIVRNR